MGITHFSGLGLKNTNTTQPSVNGELVYVTGVGFRFQQEGTIYSLPGFDLNAGAGSDAITVTSGDITLTDGEIVQTQETVTTASPTLKAYGASSIDSTSNAVNATLGSGQAIGTMKVIVMTEASNSSTVSITNHETSDPEVATFDAVDEYWLGMWTGTEWVTISNTCTFV